MMGGLQYKDLSIEEKKLLANWLQWRMNNVRD